jgi:TetR/AcrR family transcriptional regulator, transcriptional repressor for nem operon
MIGRVREFDIDDATQVAMDLFWSQGYELTSLNDLISATHLSKSSFYQAFGSKRELFTRCLSLYESGLVDNMTALLADSSSGLDFINKILLSVADETRGLKSRRGCLLMNTASEFAQSDADISKRVRHGKQQMLKVFVKAVHQAQLEKHISKKDEPEVIADYLLACVSGLKTMVKSGDSAQTIVKVSEVIMSNLSVEKR